MCRWTKITFQAPEVDLGLIAVGTEKVGAIKLRNTGDIPVSFAVLDAGNISISCLLPLGHPLHRSMWFHAPISKIQLRGDSYMRPKYHIDKSHPVRHRHNLSRKRSDGGFHSWPEWQQKTPPQLRTLHGIGGYECLSWGQFGTFSAGWSGCAASP